MRSLLLVCAIALAGCGGGNEGSDSGAADAGGRDGGARDAGERDAGLSDAGPRDAGPEDAGSSSDDGGSDAATSDAGSSDAGQDAGSACDPFSAIEDRLAGVCDFRGREICRMWAETNGGPGAVAQCTPPSGRCARADACTAGGCTCGGAPECADDEMCVVGSSGAYSCVCIAP